MKTLAILFCGTLFGAGVTVSGMINPMRVLNFMDIFGSFDATLIFVMVTGLLTTLVGYRLVLLRHQPLFETKFNLPDKTIVDRPLVAGAVMFGMGWGLTGFCPGPAIASLVFGHNESMIFMVSMATGALLVRLARGGLFRQAAPAADLEAG